MNLDQRIKGKKVRDITYNFLTKVLTEEDNLHLNQSAYNENIGFYNLSVILTVKGLDELVDVVSDFLYNTSKKKIVSSEIMYGKS